MNLQGVIGTALCCFAAFQIATAEEIHTFKRIQLHNQFWSEGANFGDINNDGKNDIVAGPWWWEGPDFSKRHEYYPATTTFKLKVGDNTNTIPGFEGTLGTKNTYSDNFFAWVVDFNKDNWNDILIIGFPGRDTSWYENPKGKAGHWKRHKIFDQTDNESPTFLDVTGDGKPELVCITKGQFGYATPDWNDPAKPWTFHPITPNNKYGNFTHGMGVGDVNGDGRLDLLEKNGWWEQPSSLSGDPTWQHHKQYFGDGGSQMYAYDVNGDGRNDVITALAAHGYGLAWYEQLAEKEEGEIGFREHIIMDAEPHENKYGVVFSELHAIDLVDMDGDGLKDIVTGKRYWSHGRVGAPDRDAPAVTYWFKLVRGANNAVDWIPYLISDEAGVGTQVVAGDINGDKRPDVVVGNKKGAFVLLHEAKSISPGEWEAAQPKPVPQPKQVAGFPAVGDDGKPLNLDFEAGSLKDWTVEGEAFAKQPVRGDRVFRRRGDMRSRHRGDYWVGSYEASNSDAPIGTLVSAPFKVTHPFASFLIGGGSSEKTRVELVTESGEVIHKTTGPNNEAMRRAVADLRKHQGATVRIRVIDEATSGWGHVNFDDFKFHNEAPTAKN
jgi:hypothetical protein